jgi:hypothetical protein
MAPVRTQKKNNTSKGLAAFGFTKIPKNETLTRRSAAQADKSSPLCVIADNVVANPHDHGMAGEITSILGAALSTEHENAQPSASSLAGTSRLPAVSGDTASLPMSASKRKLPKPVGKGEKEVYFSDSRSERLIDPWEGRYVQMLGRATN